MENHEKVKSRKYKYFFFEEPFVFVFLEGYSPLNPVRRRNVAQNKGSVTGRRSAVDVPRVPLPTTPPPSSINPTPPLQNCLHLDSGRKERRQSPVPASPSYSRPAPEEKDGSQQREEAPWAADVASVTEPDWEQQLGPVGSQHLAATTPLSQGSLSDLSRPPSSLLSGCTNLTSGRSSVMSGKTPSKTSTVTKELTCYLFHIDFRSF